jgi:hypothetical protein
MPSKASYTVIITFCGTHYECAIGEFKLGYMSGNNKDICKFDSSKITIEITRSRSYPDGTILSNNKNSVNQQIKKVITIYYALAIQFPKIKTLSIIRNYKRKQNFIYSDTNNIIQPIQLTKSRKKLAITTTCVSSLINNDPKSCALRTALTYWICGQASDNIYLQFDKYWRAFDRLILYNGDTTKECLGIKKMKSLINSHPKSFLQSIGYINNLDEEQIRGLDWIKLLRSKNKNKTDGQPIWSILKEYSDARICMMFSKIINNKNIKTILQSNDALFDEICNHFQNNRNTTNEAERVILIALTYVYYIRCKMFHAEIPDGSFKLAETKEDTNIKMLNGLIALVILELINNPNLLR